MKKWIASTIVALVVIPTLIFGRDRIVRVWAAPADLDQTKKTLATITDTQSKIVDLQTSTYDRLTRLEAKQEATDKIQNVQYETLKEMYKELKKR